MVQGIFLEVTLPVQIYFSTLKLWIQNIDSKLIFHSFQMWVGFYKIYKKWKSFKILSLKNKKISNDKESSKNINIISFRCKFTSQFFPLTKGKRVFDTYLFLLKMTKFIIK
jgi:hypothetical protein